jgi:glutamate synthase domain-containing protein 3
LPTCFDEDGSFAQRCNTAMVALERVLPAEEQRAQQDASVFHKGSPDEPLLRKLTEDHHRLDGQPPRPRTAGHWADARTKFVKVFPNEYKRALAEMTSARWKRASTGNNARSA